MVENSETFSQHISLDRIKDANNTRKDTIQCYLCKGLVWHPVECANCDERFCSSCIEQFHENHPKTSCPKDSNGYEQTINPRILMDTVAALRIKCRYEREGCENVLSYNQLEQHEINCEYQLKFCDGCKRNIIRKDFAEHYENCGDIDLPCTYCSTSYKRKEKISHTEITCLRIQVQELKKTVHDLQEQITKNNFWPELFKITQELNQLKGNISQ